MPHALALDSKPVALELFGLLRDLDPSRWRAELETSIRGRVASMATSFRALLARIDARRDEARLAQQVARLVDLLSEHAPAHGLDRPELFAAWDSYRKQLGKAYEELCLRLREEQIELPSLRPTNYTRSLVHALTGLVSVLLIEVVLDARGRAIVPALFAGTFWGLELWRRSSTGANDVMMRIFRRIAHPREAHQVNSSTWFATALAILGLTAPPAVCSVAVVVIAFADPAAAMVGRRFGRTRLVHGRTLEGSLTFLLVATAGAFVVLAIGHGAMGLGAALWIALAAALPATVVELFSRRIDDNFAVPIVAALGATVGAALLGV